MILQISLFLFSILLFITSCFFVSIDALGGMIFVVTVPLMILILIFIWNKVSKSSKILFGSIMKGLVCLHGFVVVAFFAGLFFKPVYFVPNYLITGVGFVFETFVGLSPYAWAREKSNERKVLIEELKKANEGETLVAPEIHVDWSKVCFLGPYSDDRSAAPVLGYLGATMQRSRVRDSESFVALVFLDKNGSAVGVFDIPRSVINFSDYFGSCLAKEEFPIALLATETKTKKAVSKSKSIKD